jgi:hypothetical protein
MKSSARPTIDRSKSLVDKLVFDAGGYSAERRYGAGTNGFGAYNVAGVGATIGVGSATSARIDFDSGLPVLLMAGSGQIAWNSSEYFDNTSGITLYAEWLPTGNGCIFSKWSGTAATSSWTLKHVSDNTLEFAIHAGSNAYETRQAAGAVAFNLWNKAIISWKAGTIVSAICNGVNLTNGLSLVSGSPRALIQAGTGPIRLLADNAGSIAARLRSARVWRRSLSAKEAHEAYWNPSSVYVKQRNVVFLNFPSSASPVISSTSKLEDGQALVINGGGFGTETGDAAVTISPANDIADAGAAVQTPTAWADGQITVASPTLTGMSDGDTVYVFVTDSAGTDSAGQSVQIADMVLRVGPPVATDDILDTDTGDPIASESLIKVAVLTTNLETVVATYLDASIASGKFEYDDDGVANIATEGDEFVVVMDGGDDRLGVLRATVVDRNED